MRGKPSKVDADRRGANVQFYKDNKTGKVCDAVIGRRHRLSERGSSAAGRTNATQVRSLVPAAWRELWENARRASSLRSARAKRRLFR